jgi:hypothetical protein
MTNVYERAAAADIAVPQSLPGISTNDLRWAEPGSLLPVSGDAIRRTGPLFRRPPIDNPPGGFGNNVPGTGGILSQLLSIVQQLLSMLGMGNMLGSLPGGEQRFQTAAASSLGDPHLAFSGTAASGSNRQTHFDSMSAHGDLLDSDSFAGGYQIATSVTQPGANGVTYNQQAMVSTNFGNTQISLDRSGNATVSQNGQTTSIAGGQTVLLGGGESVTRNADGSLVITDENGMGGSITTTLSENGHGVDVTAQANNVDLGGDLVNQPQQPISQALPIRMPLQLA